MPCNKVSEKKDGGWGKMLIIINNCIAFIIFLNICVLCILMSFIRVSFIDVLHYCSKVQEKTFYSAWMH